MAVRLHHIFVLNSNVLWKGHCGVCDLLTYVTMIGDVVKKKKKHLTDNILEGG